jgi:hypothetical protein
MEKMRQETWTFDSLERIGGHPVLVEGNPSLIPCGPAGGLAVAFDGLADRLLVRGTPLREARAFTVEAIFRPEAGINAQNDPRFLHLMDPEDPAMKRLMMEIRVTQDGQWALDAMLGTDSGEVSLLDRTMLHPTGRWAHAAVVYDGATLRTYVDGRAELSGTLAFKDRILEPGAIASIGCRMNRVHWFQGAIRTLRFSQGVLEPRGFLKP